MKVIVIGAGVVGLTRGRGRRIQLWARGWLITAPS